MRLLTAGSSVRARQGEPTNGTDVYKRQVETWIIPTNEELLIARDTEEIVSRA